jgi:DNA-binding transcriptional MerR regulator
VGGDGTLVAVSDDGLYSIGELAERTGLSVRTIRFYSDQGVVPPTGRSVAGHRRYDVHALARLDLVRTLRDFGLPLSTIRAVLDNGLSLPQVAATHAQALDTQINALRIRRAVLRAVAKQDITTAEEASLMHQLAKMTDIERAGLIQDFVDDTFGGLDADPEFVEMLRAATPELPEDPTPEQVRAWVELAELVQDRDFRTSVRQMAEHQAAERADGDRTGLHHHLTVFVRDTVARAIDDGITPESPEALPVLAELVSAYARTFHAVDSAAYRASLLRRLEVANDPRAERYFQLLATINGWPAQPPLAPMFEWFTRALGAHPEP